MVVCSQNYVECGPLFDIALHAGRIVSHADAPRNSDARMDSGVDAGAGARVDECGCRRR